MASLVAAVAYFAAGWLGRWQGLDCPRERVGDLQMEIEFLSG